MLLAATTSGCSSLMYANPDKAKSWSDQQIFNAQSEALIEGGGFQKNKDMLRKEMVNRNPNWPENIKNAILTGKLVIGMNKDQVLSSWGTPDNVNTTTMENFITEQWVYSREDQVCFGGMVHCATYSVPMFFAYFENDKLKSWQN